MDLKSKRRDENFGIIRRWQLSGLSQMKFCERERIPFHRFYYWYKQFRDYGKEASGGFIELTSVKALGVEPNRGTEVCFANGNRIVFHGVVGMEELRKLAG
jgi:hypothetical protein